MASRATVNQPPRRNPYSESASTAYWLQVGVNRHVGCRSGDTYVRYSSMRKIAMRAGSRRIVCTIVTGPPSATPARGSARTAVPVPAAPRSRADYSAAPGSRCGRPGPVRPPASARYAATAVRLDAAAQPTPLTCSPPTRFADPSVRPCVARARQDPVRRPASRSSVWTRTPPTVSSGIAPAAPPWLSEPDQAVSARRPLRRRLDTIARPARVLIRSRNPCTRARLRLFGWKVRLPLATATSPRASGTAPARAPSNNACRN